MTRHILLSLALVVLVLLAGCAVRTEAPPPEEDAACAATVDAAAPDVEASDAAADAPATACSCVLRLDPPKAAVCAPQHCPATVTCDLYEVGGAGDEWGCVLSGVPAG